jgi:hypothetical protein
MSMFFPAFPDTVYENTPFIPVIIPMQLLEVVFPEA